jgi:hypothetical protein
MRKFQRAVVIIALVWSAACRGDGGSGGSVLIPAPSARIILNSTSPRPTIEVVDVSPDVLAALAPTVSREAWTSILRVSVGADQPPAVGQYAVEDGRVRFTPGFPLEAGRQYHVRFTPPGGEAITATVTLPPPDATPKTIVSQLYPATDVVPENQLRLYLQFSGPMSVRRGLGLVHLLDASGQEVKDAFMPLAPEFWDDERTSYAVFFDPALKDGGTRALTRGRMYTVVVDTDWRDANGLPLKQAFRRTFTAGPPDERPLDPKTWKIAAPAAGSGTALTIGFPEPIDRGMLLRGISVMSPGGKPLEGQVVIGPQELTWSFTPVLPWKAGRNSIVVSALEDLAGNGIGRAFDVEYFDRAEQAPYREKTVIPVMIKP